MRDSAARAAVPALVVLALVAVVAVAATGSTTRGTGETRPPADSLLDTFLTLGLLLLIPGTALLVYGLMQRKAIQREALSGKYHRVGVLGWVVFTGVFAFVVWLRLRNSDFTLQPPQEENPLVVPERPGTEPPPDGGQAVTGYEPEFAWLPALVIVALALVAGLALFLASRRRHPALSLEQEAALALADALDETLDDLRAETDPRRAVIRAYARFERVLGSHGLPRKDSETPEEFLARALGALTVDEHAARRLTDLFEAARFSLHEVDRRMKEEAIDALERVRDELTAAANREPDGDLAPGAATADASGPA